LTAGSNIGFSLVCQAYCTLELFQNSAITKVNINESITLQLFQAFYLSLF